MAQRLGAAHKAFTGLTADMRIFGSMVVARFSDAFPRAVGKQQLSECPTPWPASDTMEMRPSRTFEGISASNLAMVEILLARSATHHISAAFILSVWHNLQTSWRTLQLEKPQRVSAGQHRTRKMRGIASKKSIGRGWKNVLVQWSPCLSF